MLVITQEKAFTAMALIASHHVDTGLLAATIPLCTLIHIYSRNQRENEKAETYYY